MMLTRILLFLLSLAALPAHAADVSFIGHANATAGVANTLTVNNPTGTTAGDLVVIVGTRNAAASGDSIVDDNGATPFTKVREDWETSNGSQLVIFRRVIQSGDPASWTFDFSGDTGATRFSLVAMTFRDQHADLFDVLPSGSTVTQENPDGGDLVCNGNTTTVDNSIHVVVAGREGAAAYEGLPVGYTSLFPGQYVNQPQTSAYKVVATAGATGSQTFTQAGSGAGICQSFTIKNNTDGGGGGGGDPVSTLSIRQSISCAGAADYYADCTLPSPPIAGNKLVLLVTMQQYPWTSSCSNSNQFLDPDNPVQRQTSHYDLGVEGPRQGNSQSSIWTREVTTTGSGTWLIRAQCYPWVNTDPADTYIALTVLELAGAVPSYAAFESPGWAGARNATSLTVTSAAPTTQADGLAVAVLSMNVPNATLTTQAGWTELRNNGNSATYAVGAAALKPIVAATTPAHTWGIGYVSASGADDAQAVIGFFRAAQTGGGGGTPASVNRTLRWTDNATNESGFRVEKRTDQSFPTWVAVANNLNPNTTTYTATILATETGDCWRVFAVNANGERMSNEACGPLPNVPPMPPPAPPPPVIQIGGLQTLMDDELL